MKNEQVYLKYSYKQVHAHKKHTHLFPLIKKDIYGTNAISLIMIF